MHICTLFRTFLVKKSCLAPTDPQTNRGWWPQLWKRCVNKEGEIKANWQKYGNLTQAEAINNFYYYLPRWSGRPSTGSGRTTTWTTSSMWSLSSTRRCASTAVSLPFFRHLLSCTCQKRVFGTLTWISFLSTLLIDRQENATWRATIRATRRYLSTNKRTFPRSRVTMKWCLSCWWNCFVLLQKNQLGNPYWHDAVYSQIQWTVGTKCVKHAI